MEKAFLFGILMLVFASASKGKDKAGYGCAAFLLLSVFIIAGAFALLMAIAGV